MPRSCASWQRSRDGFEVRRSEEHTSELQSPCNLVCRLLLEKKILARMALVPAIRHLFDRGLRLDIFTSGVLMDNKLDRYSCPHASVHLSLDAATGEIHAGLKLRGFR